MIDIGIITGSGIYKLPGDQESHVVESRFGEAEVAILRVGPWNVGSISRHGKAHYHLPHTIPYRANLMSLKQLGAPENRLPNGEPCTIFTEPGDPERGHLIGSEPFSPSLRRKMELAARDLGIEATLGGVYVHTNGPRFETRAEIKALNAAGVTAVSQTCGPEVVLAGELDLPYGLVGFPVNYATGSRSRTQRRSSIACLHARPKFFLASSSERWRC